ncbi:hypothetical protein LCGC14_2320960 [marine sediment metagenome]|uniref:Uncharacterized protein n=1 Tax=marine sediment metagenome TaxID=412755 RepID=A0A0F9CHW8_9ZZZZ
MSKKLERAKVCITLTEVGGKVFSMNHSTHLVDGNLEFLTDAEAHVIYDALCESLVIGHLLKLKEKDSAD